MFSIIGWAIFGLVAGAIARLLHPGRDTMNWLWPMLLGIGGALVGGFVGEQIGIRVHEGVISWIAAIGGAVLLLFLYHMTTARRARAAGGDYCSADSKSSVLTGSPEGRGVERRSGKPHRGPRSFRITSRP